MPDARLFRLFTCYHYKYRQNKCQCGGICPGQWYTQKADQQRLWYPLSKPSVKSGKIRAAVSFSLQIAFPVAI